MPLGPPARPPAKIIVAAAITALGCAEAPTVVPTEQPEAIGLVAPAFAMVCSEGAFTGFSASLGWDCNSTVQFYTNNSALAPYAAQAVVAWNGKLAATGFSDLPTFTTTEFPSQAEATVTGTSNGTAFCGTWNNGPRVLTVYSDAGCALFDNSGPLATVLLHEVGHAVGWTGSSVDKVNFATAAASHCVMNLPLDGSLNTSICVHEIEGALAAYGLVSYDVGNFFTKHFVVGTASGLTPLSLQPSQTANLSPGNWRLEGGALVPGTSSSYAWSTTSSAVATVAGGTVTAVGPGTATIRAKPTSSSSYLFAHPFRTSGVSATVTVSSPPPPPPPPPPPYVVTSDQMPIVTPGAHAFTAHIGSPSSTVYWRVDDSRTTTIDPDTTFSTNGQVATLSIGAGSYTLIFKVALSPYPSSWQEQHIPVCTEGAQENLAGSGKSGGGETDAVENCPPPDGDPPEYE